MLTILHLAAHDPKDVLPAFEKSLKDLGLDYIDLYLMHYPCAMDPNVDGIKVLDIPYTATWAAMEGKSSQTAAASIHADMLLSLSPAQDWKVQKHWHQQ